MKTSLLATVAAIGLIAGSGVAMAQRQEAPPSKAEGATPAPPAQRAAPAEKVAPGGSAAPQRGADTKAEQKSTIGQSAPKADDNKSRSNNAASESDRKSGSRAEGNEGSRGGRSAAEGKDGSPSGRNAADRNNTATDRNGERNNRNASDRNNANSNNRNAGDDKSRSGRSETTARGHSDQTNVTLTTEQKTKVRSVVMGANAPRVNSVNFSINVGTVVPRSVRVVRVPQTLVEIHPAWRDYMYFVTADEIIIVEPGTLRIVAVLDV
jgi:hypothetical protein